jgi:iron complex outermembrane receptor protein
VNDADVTEEAIFFDIKKTFWSSLDIQVGARIYETSVIGGYDMVGSLARAANRGDEVSIHAEIPEKGVSPKLSATYHFNDDISTYAQASRGFRFGGVQTIPANEAEGIPPVFKSDSLWNYELGLRTAWLENTLQFDVVAFLIDYTDPQVLQQSASSNLAYKDNVGSAESTGVEASLFWLTSIDGLTLSLNGGLLDAHTSKEFVDSAGNVIPVGTQMPGAADKQYSATISYSGLLGAVGFNSYASYSYVGKNFGDLSQTEAVNDYGVLNAGVSLFLNEVRLRPQLSINVSNIRDVIAPIGGGSREVATGDRQELYIMNAPRTVNARLSFEF